MSDDKVDYSPGRRVEGSVELLIEACRALENVVERASDFQVDADVVTKLLVGVDDGLGDAGGELIDVVEDAPIYWGQPGLPVPDWAKQVDRCLAEVADAGYVVEGLLARLLVAAPDRPLWVECAWQAEHERTRLRRVCTRLLGALAVAARGPGGGR